MTATINDVRCDENISCVIEGPTILVIVGKEKRDFHVHEKLLRAHSAFFDTALSNNRWKESQVRTIELPEDDAATFGRYVHWLYSGKVASKRANGRDSYAILAELYVIGEKFMDKTFQDTVINVLVSATREKRSNGTGKRPRSFPVGPVVDTLYCGTPPGSPARRLMVDLHVVHGNPSWVSKGSLDSNNKEFLVDLAAALLGSRAAGTKTAMALAELEAGVPCSYHQHGKDELCGGQGG